MKHVWLRAPFLRLFTAFAMGIIASSKLGFVSWALLSTSVLWLLAVLWAKWLQRWKYRFFSGLALSFSFFSLGVAIPAISDPAIDQFHFSNLEHNQISWFVEVNSLPTKTSFGYKCSGRVLGAMDSTGVRCLRGEIILYMDSAFAMPGDLCTTMANIDSLPALDYPFAFDYSAYLKRNGIHGSMHWTIDNCNVMDTSGRHDLSYFFLYSREFLIDKMRAYTSDEKVLGVLEALVLGKTTDMDKEIVQDYSAAGAVHILAVSGMHVGLIYALLAPLFKRTIPKKQFRWGKTLIPLFILWAFAGVTGFSASVLRAALMFSFFIVADNFQRKGNPLNTMAASAMLLLLINPEMLFNVGFQLSYAAVLGIVTLHRRLLLLISFSNNIMQSVWSLTAVSIAAQLTTLPFILYYFHQFPVYFLICNLLAVPLSGIILYIMLFFLATCTWPALAWLSMNLATSLTIIMNDIVSWSAHLPGGLISEIRFGLFEFLFLSCLLFGICRLLLFHSRQWIFPTLSSLLCLLVVGVWREAVVRKQTFIYTYVSRQNIVPLLFLEGQNFIVTADSTFKSTSFYKNRMLAAVLEKTNSSSQIALLPSDTCSWRIDLNSQSMVYLHSPEDAPCLNDSVNLVILGKNWSKRFCEKSSLALLRFGKHVAVVGSWSEKRRRWFQQELPDLQWMEIGRHTFIWKEGEFRPFEEF